MFLKKTRCRKFLSTSLFVLAQAGQSHELWSWDRSLFSWLEEGDPQEHGFCLNELNQIKCHLSFHIAVGMTVDPAMRMTTWLTFVWTSPVSQHPPHSQIRATLEMHTGAVTRWWTGRGHADTIVIDRVTSGFSSHTKPGHKQLMWINSVILTELSAWGACPCISRSNKYLCTTVILWDCLHFFNCTHTCIPTPQWLHHAGCSFLYCRRGRAQKPRVQVIRHEYIHQCSDCAETTTFVYHQRTQACIQYY